MNKEYILGFFPERQTFPNMLFLLTTVDIISKTMQNSFSFSLHLVPMQSFDSYFLHPSQGTPSTKAHTERTLQDLLYSSVRNEASLSQQLHFTESGFISLLYCSPRQH